MDFFKVRDRTTKKGTREIFPEFLVRPSKDLMVRGHAFYAIWDEENGIWSQDEHRVQEIVDHALREKFEKVIHENGDQVSLQLMEEFSSKSWTTFCNYILHMPDNFHQLDESLTFANTPVKKTDYVSRRLSYALEAGSHEAFDEMLGVLYSEEEREKLLWAIGSIVAGDSKNIQKFIALYGDPGKGKGTVIDIISWLFEDYCASLDVEALTSNNNAFATDVFRKNPLVGIEHDTKLSKIDKNTTFNSIVSHEIMNMKQKYKDSYDARANCFIFVGTNDPIMITNGKSGLLRRLIDVSPTGEKIPAKRYRQLKNQIKFELGAIAEYCMRFYQERGMDYYDAYRPLQMQFKTDPFFNFVDNYRLDFEREDGISLSVAYTWYKEYIKDGGGVQMQRYKFREELKNYFRNFDDLTRVDGKQVRSWYSGFMSEKFTGKAPEHEPVAIKVNESAVLVLDQTESLLDAMLKDCPAQYATEEGRPACKWLNVKTVLSELDTHRLHYILLPKQHIVIDFDIRDPRTGEKSRELNLQAAAKWPRTYAEFSKSGEGIHLHYIYTGDVARLANNYADGIEIKALTGNASLRRQLTFCNKEPVAVISGGLPLKEGRKLLNEERLKSEHSLRNLIERNLNKEIHPGTKPSIDFIEKILSDAYDNGLKYDVTDLQKKILLFAMRSTNHREYCVKAVGRMKFKSEVPSDAPESKDDDPIIFFDCEVFPNLLVICWKYAGPDNRVIRMINPTADEVHDLCRYKLVGFNCRKYDNHILYARMMDMNNEQVYKVSQAIITQKSKSAFFGEAYNLSYTDIYDFCSTKQGLKKWEIALGIHHQELGIPWDQEVPEDRWSEVADYCVNDVMATEAVFNANKADWTARQILADIAGMTVNDTTNSLTTRIIFGTERSPQSMFNYRDMGDESQINSDWFVTMDLSCPEFCQFDHEGDGRPVFPGYIYDKGVSTYRGEEVGEGGYVYSEPGAYSDVALLDIASMHPSSIVAENLFGPYTARFKDLLDIRVAIKHKEFEKARHMLDGKLAPYLTDENQAKQLSKALKIAINSVYGLTSAKFENPFHDPRNKDNIVAKRGALFMINLKHEVQAKGFTVAHIKTDSIKIPNATPEIISFVKEYGQLYGYTFEHEATFEKLCLVDKAQYIAKFATPEFCMLLYGYVPEECEKNPETLTMQPGRWTATGDCFRTPYVFKKLFSHEDIVFSDLCETKTVQTALYLDMNENLVDVSEYEKGLEKLLKNRAGLPDEEFEEIAADLKSQIAKGHNYIYVGRAGLFCPIVDGGGGGKLVREKDGKYYAAAGAKDYRWLEAEQVRMMEKENLINRAYFDKLVDDVVANMREAAKHTGKDPEWVTEERSSIHG